MVNPLHVIEDNERGLVSTTKPQKLGGYEGWGGRGDSASFAVKTCEGRAIEARPRSSAGPIKWLAVQVWGVEIKTSVVLTAMALDSATKSELEELVKSAQGKVGIVVGMQRLLTRLSQVGLMRTQTIEPGYIGCHVQNRDGFGIAPQACHQLLEDIVEVGFDPRECNPICCDVDRSDSTIFEFNTRLADNSFGLLPPISKHQLCYASLSASHTNAALRCILASTPHDEKSKLVVDGKLQLEQVKAVDFAMYEAATKGLSWRVISSQAMSIPGLADVIQAGCNTTAQLSRGESEFQILKRVLNSINANGGAGTNLLFATVKQSIMKTKPQCAEAVPEMFTFLVRYGASKPFQERICRIEERIKGSKESPRNLGAEFFRCLSMDHKDAQQDACVHFRHAVLSLAYCGQDRKMVNASDVRRVTSKDPKIFGKVLDGQKIIKKVQADFSAVNLDSLEAKVRADCLQALDEFEDAVVLMCLEKKASMTNLEEAACVLVDKLFEVSKVKISSDYDAHRKTTTTPQRLFEPVVCFTVHVECVVS